MNDAELERLRALPKRVDWVLWLALQAGVVVLLGIAAAMNALPHSGPVRQRLDLGLHLDFVFPVVAALPITAGLFVYGINIVHGPRPNGRVAKSVSARLLEMKSASDVNRFVADTLLFVDGNFRGASILTWAIGEGGALLAAIYAMLGGFHSAGIAAILYWFVGMASTAPTAARRRAYRGRALCAAGLDDAVAEQLLARAAN